MVSRAPSPRVRASCVCGSDPAQLGKSSCTTPSTWAWVQKTHFYRLSPWPTSHCSTTCWLMRERLVCHLQRKKCPRHHQCDHGGIRIKQAHILRLHHQVGEHHIQLASLISSIALHASHLRVFRDQHRLSPQRCVLICDQFLHFPRSVLVCGRFGIQSDQDARMGPKELHRRKETAARLIPPFGNSQACVQHQVLRTESRLHVLLFTEVVWRGTGGWMSTLAHPQ